MRAMIIAKILNGEAERVAISLQRDDGGSRIGRGEQEVAKRRALTAYFEHAS